MFKDNLRNKEIAKIIGENLKYYRNQRGLTLRDLSTRIEYTAGYINLIEKGKEAPNSFIVEMLAKGLNIPVSYLLEERKRVNLNINDPILYKRDIKEYFSLFKELYKENVKIEIIKAAFDALKPIYDFE